MAGTEYSMTNCIKTMSSEYPPYTRIVGNSSDYVVTGVMPIAMAEIGKKLGVCFEHLAIFGQGYGKILPNGTFTGVLGYVQSNKAQICLPPLKISTSRNNVFLASPQVNMSPFGALFKTPLVEPDLLGFVKAFTTGVWIWLFAIVLGISVVFYLQDLICEKYFVPLNPTRYVSQEGKISLMESFFLSLQILLFQSVSETVFLVKIPLTIGLWIMSAFIIGMAYKGVLMSMLIIPRINIPFNNVEEMVAQDAVMWTMAAQTVFTESIQYAEKGSILNAIYEGGDYSFEHEEVMKKVLSGEFAFIGAQIGLRGFMERDARMTKECRFAKMKEGFWYQSSVMLYNKNFTLANEINWAVTAFTEFGLFDRLERNFMKNFEKCSTSNDQGNNRPLTLTDFLGIFALFAAGLCLSIVVFAIELIVHKAQMRKEKRNKTEFIMKN